MELDKPKMTLTEDKGGNSAKFVVEPLERGYGTTLGNLLRRVLLSNLPGTAVVAVRIAGVNNEFSTIKGVREDVTDIVLNLKSLILKSSDQSPEFKTTMRINKSGAGAVTAKDIEKTSEITVCNPDLVICTLDGGAKLEMELTIGNGRGYVVAKDQKGATESIGYIAIDSLFSPVDKCNYYVESARVGQKIDYDKLVLEVATNGSVDAKEVVSLAAKLVQDHLGLFVGLVSGMANTSTLIDCKEDTKVKLLETSIEDMELSPRSSNCLKRANINTVEDLVKKTKNDMLKVRNLGSKSLDEIIFKLEALGLSLRADEDGGLL
ncbi:MAG: DNA-directed RNA polymerase subunit alpha [Christensenellaceae bacterium]|jgi:DNA-directed RNA polymerase subunit alpha|nr:DNA-directed RNA polymerase subunit alpha [Christensenellaceae bacterium]